VLFDATRRALTTRMKGDEPTAGQVAEGARYLIAELPLCMDAPTILGAPSSVNIYHQVLPMIPVMFASPRLRVSPRQAFAVVRPADEPADEPADAHQEEA
jgi:cyclo(L-tyrosyl-L-tyrosyl) synthase